VIPGGGRWAYCACAVVALAAAGCPFKKSVNTVRVEGHYLTWIGEDMADLGSEGEAYGFEIAPGDDSQPAMGPLYIGGAYSVARVEGGSEEHRAGVRARSSMLSRSSSSFPYAMVGVYMGWLERAEGDAKFGAGIEGGYGVRLAMKGIAFDLEMILGYGLYVAGFDQLSTRLGGGLVISF
jgi:hypothetical protein